MAYTVTEHMADISDEERAMQKSRFVAALLNATKQADENRAAQELAANE